MMMEKFNNAEGESLICDVLVEYFDSKKKFVTRKFIRESAEISYRKLANRIEFRIKSTQQLQDVYIVKSPKVLQSSVAIEVCFYLIEYNCKMTCFNSKLPSQLELIREFIAIPTICATKEIKYQSPAKKSEFIIFSPAKGKSKKISPIKLSPDVKKSATTISTPAKFTIKKLSTPTKIPIQIRITNPVHDNIFAACREGKNVFISGGAGTGKTVLLLKLVEMFRGTYGKESVFATATTGLAAFGIGGITIHQYAGIGKVEEYDDLEEIAKQISMKTSVYRRINQTKVLLIDEVSMLGFHMIELLDMIMKKCRNSNKPMGGIQVIFCGDFFQLPPVKSVSISKDKENLNNLNIPTSKSKASPRFCFESSLWNQTFQNNNIILKETYRQKDCIFVEYLENIRKGIVTNNMLNVFNQCVNRKFDTSDGILPTRLYTHRNDVDMINFKELSQLSGDVVTYTARDSGEEGYLRMLNSNSSCKEVLRLKLGAQVILLKTINASEGLVNGARGVVISETKRPIVRFENGIERNISNEIFNITIGGKVLAERSQIPLDLSWAISVHKAQGITVEKAHIDLRKVFECGQAYVALSRVKSLSGLSLTAPLQSHHIRCDSKVIEFYEIIEKANEDK